MASPDFRRWLLLGGALGVTLLLVWQSPVEEEPVAVVQPRRSAALPAAGEAAPRSEPFALAARAPAAEEYIDLFALRETRAERQDATPVAPVVPMPPPLPFTYIGQMIEDGRSKVFLQEGSTLHAVVEGDLLGRSYQVLGIESNRINLLYLPLNMTQTISVGNRLE
jgi:hypothetical protein